jgi:hypothetical protein
MADVALTNCDSQLESTTGLLKLFMMESTAMSARFMVIAAAALATAGVAVAAEPVKPEVQQASQPTTRPAQVLLASAEQVQAPVAPSDQPAPVKRRAARVTTCRCGDPEQQQQH